VLPVIQENYFRRETEDADPNSRSSEVEKRREQEKKMEEQENKEQEQEEVEEAEEEDDQGLTVVHSMEVQNLIIQESQSFTLGNNMRYTYGIPVPGTVPVI
jgi:ADP-ribosylglycohydrolase